MCELANFGICTASFCPPPTSLSQPRKFQDFPGPCTQISRTFQDLKIVPKKIQDFPGAWEPCDTACLFHLSVAVLKATKTLQNTPTFLIVKLGKKPLTTICATSESFEAMKSLIRCFFEPMPYSNKLKLWQLQFNKTKHH